MRSFCVIISTIFTLTEAATIHAGNVWVWGDFSGAVTPNSVLTNVPPSLTNAVSVGAGRWDAIALTTMGTVVCWGDNTFGRTNVPTGLTNIVAIAAGDGHDLALRADGTVVAWGDNTFGQCSVPANLSGVVAISAGTIHSLAVRANGTVVAWGANYSGETNVPPDLTNAVAVSGGGNFSLALLGSGTVVAWGYNYSGETSIPAGLKNVTAIAAGTSHSLALQADGTVVAWGDNTDGECQVPPDLTNAIAIAAGNLSSMAVRADGTVVAWGFDASTPTNLTGVTAIAIASAPFTGLALASASQGSVAISTIGPLSQTVEVGSQAFFSVAALGSQPLSYQWLFGTNAITGATNSSLPLYNVQTSQAGSYSVVVSNVYGAITSQSLVLNVVPGLDINMVPALTLKGGVGLTYRIDFINAIGPTNNWTALATVTLTNGQQFYFDASAIGQPSRVYRVVQVP